MKTKRTWWLAMTALLLWLPSANAFYDPGAQRWINRDPIGEIGGDNLFCFAMNSPVNKRDLIGLKTISIDPEEAKPCGMNYGGGFLVGYAFLPGSDEKVCKYRCVGTPALYIDHEAQPQDVSYYLDQSAWPPKCKKKTVEFEFTRQIANTVIGNISVYYHYKAGDRDKPPVKSRRDEKSGTVQQEIGPPELHVLNVQVEDAEDKLCGPMPMFNCQEPANTSSGGLLPWGTKWKNWAYD